MSAIDVIRKRGLCGVFAALWSTIVRFFVGAEPFCAWPGCMKRVDPTCSGVSFGRPDERYCPNHCYRWHRDGIMSAAGFQADCPVRDARVIVLRAEGNQP